MTKWGHAVWVGLCLGLVGCGGSSPQTPSQGCEATASCDGNRGGTPTPDSPGQSSPGDAGTPPGPGDAGTPPPKTGGGTPSSATGETLWLRHDAVNQSEFAASVATTSDGQALYTASMGGGLLEDKFVKGANPRFILRRYSASGALQWTREFKLIPDSQGSPDNVRGRLLLTVGPTGALYLLTDVRGGSMSRGDYLLPGVALSKLSPNGEFLWSTLPTNDALVSAQALALVASREDGVFVSVRESHAQDSRLQCAASETVIARYDANGGMAWRTLVGERECEGSQAEVLALAAQPDGGVAFGGASTRWFRTPLGSTNTPMESPFLGTLTSRGEWGWLKLFPQSEGRILSLGSSAKGTVVAAGALSGGSFTWGKDALGQAPSVLLVAEADGTPRWAQSLGRVESPVIAVEPAGRVAVAGLSRDAPAQGSEPAGLKFFARRYNLAGKLLWTRFFKRSGGPGGYFTEQVVSAAPSGEGSGNTLLLGHFSHTEDFGTGPRTPLATDLFLLKLGAGPEF